MSQHNTKYPEGLEFNVKVKIEYVEGPDGSGYDDNYRINVRDSCGDTVFETWVGQRTIDFLISAHNPEIKKEITKLQIKKLQEQINQLNKELEENV